MGRSPAESGRMNVSGSVGSEDLSGNGGLGASGAEGIGSAGSAELGESGSGGAAGGEAGNSGAPESGGSSGGGGAVGAAAGAVSGTGGAVSGAGGGQGGNAACQAAQDSEKLPIDDLEDGDSAIQPFTRYGGYWYVYNDGTGSQTPDVFTLFKPTAPGHCTPLFAATTSGKTFTQWGAGLGMRFFDYGNTHAFDASAFKGIQFWARANVNNMQVKIMIGIPETTGVENGGTCVPSGKLICEDHYFLKPAPVLTRDWTLYKIAFSDTQTFGQAGFGAAVAFDKSQLLSLQFLVFPNVTFDFSVDDVGFF